MAHSSTRKYRRALEHLQQVGTDLDQLILAGRDAIAFENDTSTGEPVLIARYTGPVPPEALAEAIGDCVQNLRASLDHMIFELAPDPQRTNNPKQFAFPIFIDQAEYKRKGQWRVRDLTPAAMADIEQLQPYRTGDRNHPLCYWKSCQTSISIVRFTLSPTC